MILLGLFFIPIKVEYDDIVILETYVEKEEVVLFIEINSTTHFYYKVKDNEVNVYKTILMFQ